MLMLYRRGSAGQNDRFTGKLGEVTIDLTNRTLRIHDGVKAGGYYVRDVMTLSQATIETLIDAQISELHTEIDQELTALQTAILKKLPRWFTSAGEQSQEGVKIWTGTVSSATDGTWTATWSTAGFTVRPFHILPTILQAATTVLEDIAWATVLSTSDKTTGRGYTMRGNKTSVLLGGTVISTRAAPNMSVQITAWGR